MESLNLHTLASSLPTAQQNAEKELLNNFKAAALSITTLYRSSRQNSKRAYNAGYAAACEDLLNNIQQGVSVAGVAASGPGSQDAEDGGMTIGRVMDWIEARLEAIKAREEEEDEDEEKEKERGGRPAAPAPPGNRMPKPDVSKPNMPIASTSGQPTREAHMTLPTPHSPIQQPNPPLPAEPSSPSPPPSASIAPRPTARPIKARTQMKTESTGPHPPLSTTSTPMFNLHSDPSFPETPIAIGAGAKRRHAMMMMLDAAPSSVSLGGSSASSHSSPAGPGNASGTPSHGHGAGTTLSRRRTRSSRNLPLQQPQNQNINVIQATSEAMDVEEDGRERKRVARERR